MKLSELSDVDFVRYASHVMEASESLTKADAILQLPPQLAPIYAALLKELREEISLRAMKMPNHWEKKGPVPS